MGAQLFSQGPADLLHHAVQQWHAPDSIQALQDARLFSRQHAKNFDLNAVVKSYLDVLQQAGAGREK